MSRMLASWLSGPESAGSGGPAGYPGERLGLPEQGTGALAPMRRRLAALGLDWLVAYGLAGLGAAFGVVTPALLSTAVLVIWLVLGAAAVRLFGFTPGQFCCRLRVVSVDQRGVGSGRALARVALIALVVPPLFSDADGRGLQDRATATAVVRR